MHRNVTLDKAEKLVISRTILPSSDKLRAVLVNSLILSDGKFLEVQSIVERAAKNIYSYRAQFAWINLWDR